MKRRGLFAGLMGLAGLSLARRSSATPVLVVTEEAAGVPDGLWGRGEALLAGGTDADGRWYRTVNDGPSFTIVHRGPRGRA